MYIKPFAVEEWMNEYEVGARFNIAETCVDSVSLDQLFALTGVDKQAFLADLCAKRLTYGDIVGSDALRGKDMLLALDGEDSPYLTENCLLKDTDTPVAERVQKLFVLDKNNMASPETAESE